MKPLCASSLVDITTYLKDVDDVVLQEDFLMYDHDIKSESDFDETNGITHEMPCSVEGWLETFQRMVQITINSDVLNVVKNFLMALISAHLFPKNLAMNITKTLGIRKAKLNVLEFMSLILQGVQTMLVYGKALMNGMSLNEIVMAEDPVSLAITKIRRLERASKMLSDGLPKEGYMDMKTFFIQAKELVETSQELANKMSPFHPKYVIFKDMTANFADLYYRTKDECNSSSRVPPVAVVLEGYPGTGKSKLLTYIARVWSKVKGREYDDTQVFSRCTTSQYWDHYDPNTKPFIHMSELGNMSKKQAETHGDAILSELLSLVDGLPFPCDMSAVEDKGKVFARPELILVDTNNAEMHVKQLMFSPGAVKRRFIYINVEVLPEFRADGTTALDSAKSMAAGPNYLDRYIFTVTTFTSNKNTPVPRKEMVGDIYALTDWLSHKFESHISLQEKVDGTELFSFLYKKEDEESEFDDESDSDEISFIPHDTSSDNEIDTEEIEFFPEFDFDDDDLNKEDEEWYDYALSLVENPDDYYLDDITLEEAKAYIILMDEILDEDLIVAQSESAFIPLVTIFMWRRVIMCIIFLLSQVLSISHFVFAKTTSNVLKALSWALDTRIERVCLGFLACCVYMLHQFNCFPMLSLIFVLALFYDDLLKNILKYGFDEAVDMIVIKKDEAVANVHDAIVGKFRNPFKSVEFYVVAVMGITSMVGIFQIWRNHIHSTPESHDIIHPVYEKEQKLKPGITLVRNKLDDKKFNLMEIEPSSLTKFHGEPRELNDSLSSSIIRARILTEDSGCFTYILGVTGTYAILNLHATAFKDSFTVLISPTNNWENPQFNVDVLPIDIVTVTDDVVLVNLKKRPFKNIMHHFVDKIPRRFDGLMLEHSLRVRKVSDIHVEDRNGTFVVRDGLHYSLPHHDVGMCGLPIIGQVNHNGSAIVGIHGSGDSTSDSAYAIQITLSDLKRAVDALDKVSVYVPNLSMRAVSESLTTPNPKSLIHYLEINHVRYMGKLDEPVLMNKASNLRRTPFASDVLDTMYTVMDFVPQVEVGPPPMRAFTRNGQYYSPTHVAIKKMDNDPPTLNPYVMSHVIEVLTKRIVNGLRTGGITKLSPLSMDDAINGVEEDAFISRINASTGSGYGFTGKKSVYLPLNEDRKDRVTREPTDFLRDKIDNLMECYENGDMACPIVQSQLKDEARLKSKNDIGATRMFYMTSTDMLVLSRMLLAPFYSTMVEKGELFCTSVGINMHQDAHEFVETLRDFSPYIMEGDYSGYDVANPVEIARAANTVIYNVLAEMGYNDYALKILQGLLSDLLFPILSVDTDLFMKAGMQPSGKYGTAEDNSLRGLIMLMYAWYEDHELQSKYFFDYVLPRIYGDDLLAAVKEDVITLYNNTTYCTKCNDLYGMTFTSAAKDGSLSDYLTVDTMSFLKRKFVVDEETGKWVAQLSLESVSKALTWYLPSQEVTVEYQSLSCMGSMLWELFFHLKEHDYNRMRNAFIDILSNTFQSTPQEYDSELPTYTMIYERINHVNVVAESEWESGEASVHNGNRECCLAKFGQLTLQKTDESHLSNVEANIVIVNKSKNFTESERLTNMAQSLKIEKQNRLDALVEPQSVLANMSINELRDNNNIWTYPVSPFDMRERIRELSDIRDLEVTIERIDRLTSYRIDAYSEADMDGNGMMDLKEDMENMVDVMGNQENEVLEAVDFMWDQGQSNELDLDDFFCRPVKIIERSIAPGGSFSSIYPIWDLYTLNPAIRSKLRNYAYLRGDLHIQIEISGTPFHFGHLFVSYQPYPLRNENLVQQALILGNKQALVNYLSQSEQFGTMNVNSNTPLHMECPFISTKPMNRLYNTSALVLADTTSYDDFAEFGSLYIGSYWTVEAAAAAASDIGLRVYAWLENVNLGTTTATQIAITTESEMRSGPVERVATRLANLSRQLQAIEPIRPLATASEMILRGIGGVASWYGWSRPVKVGEPMYVKNRPYTNGAQVIGSDTCKRITLDPLQELTVDPRVCAYDEDDMTISNICNRLSFVDLFVWSPADDLMSNSIWKSKVHPQLCTIVDDITYQYVQPTAMAFAATPFLYWRGDITFHFEIMCSRYHRGKLAFYYEPNVEQFALIDADVSTHKNYIKIVDIQEEQSFDLCVEWASPRAWLKMIGPEEARKNMQDFDPAVNSYGYTNGYIGVTPFNELASPDGSSIRILVFVKSDNMAYNQISNEYLAPTRIETESEFDEKYACISLNDSSATMNSINEYHFGEAPLSFRSLIKRYTFEISLSVGAAPGTENAMRFLTPVFHGPRPSYSTANFYPNLMGYLSYAYLGYRGSLRKRVRAITNDTSAHPLQGVVVTMVAPTSATSSSLAWISPHATSTLTGSVTFIPDTNGGVEFEIPFYSNNLFAFAFADDGIGSNPTGDMEEEWSKTIAVEVETHDTTKATNWVVEDTAAGDDFTFLRFNGAPFYRFIL
jgi:hypothetical protein